MRRVIWQLLPALILGNGCASYQSAGEKYAARGRHELAALYFAAAYRQQSSDDARAILVRSIEAASKGLLADHEAMTEKGRPRAALGAATRRDELLRGAVALGLGEFEAGDGADVHKALAQLRRESIAEVDRVEAEGKGQKELLVALRQAMALSPNDPELVRRYQGVQRRLQLSVAVATDCAAAHKQSCGELAARLVMQVTQQKRELIRIVDAASDQTAALLTVRLDVRPRDSQWQRVSSGVAKGKVERKNRFRETVRNAKGKKEYQKVKAKYQVFERTASARVTIDVSLRDLGPKGGTLFDKDMRLDEKSKRTYLTWDGDERALGSLAGRGTDRTPPTSPELLARKAWERAAGPIADALLKTLEERPQ